MWFYLVTLVGLYHLLRWYHERQVVSHLQDKYVFITGCDSGFGNLLARQLDRRGMRVLAACLTEKGAEELRSKTSDRLETVILDVTKTESIVAATQWTKERVGNRGLWGLVNNAAIPPALSYLEWLQPEDSMAVFQVNFIGLVQATLSMLSLVKKAQGRIVNVSSVLGRLTFSGGFYSCSKYGIEAFPDIQSLQSHQRKLDEVLYRPEPSHRLHGARADLCISTDPIPCWLGCLTSLHPSILFACVTGGLHTDQVSAQASSGSLKALGMKGSFVSWRLLL